MLLTKFHGNRSAGSGEDFLRVFTIYGRGGRDSEISDQKSVQP